MKILTISAGFCLSVLIMSFRQLLPNQVPNYKEKLSDYGIFEGKLSAQIPAKGVIPYSLNTPLFTDYAEKLRFIKLPNNQPLINYNPQEVFDFPIGTILVKTFYYPIDYKNPTKGRKLIETRLLLHEPTGWKALPYIWNDEQTDAYLEVAGEVKEIAYTDATGTKQTHQYSIPNMNQCKGCHNRGEKLMPIGPSARQLNGKYTAWNIEPSTDNQLVKLQQMGILQGMPSLAEVPKGVVWNDATSGTLNQRARIYLDINCAHCHRPDGPANTSGLDLRIHNQDLTSYGINKAPVAAGRGSGNRKADIVPQKPHDSILWFRLNSADPGIMMPELGRRRIHQEGVELIREWIEKM